MTIVAVTKKGQVTIPVKIRKKFGIEEISKVEIVEEQGKIVIKKCPSIFDLAGSGVWKSTDHGETWFQLESTANNQLLAAI